MRADRLLSLLMILQSKGRQTAQSLAEELEVSERTIYRDITALSTSGVPVYCERGPGGGIELIEKALTIPPSDYKFFTENEIYKLNFEKSNTI